MSAEPLTVAETLRRSADYLRERGSESARLDAEVLLAHALGIERMGLYTDHLRPLTAAEREAMRDLLRRRGRRVPVAHLVRRRAFRALELVVSEAVLVPRPETELLVEWALELAPPGAHVLDWGTGSGAITLALASERPDLALVAIDRSPAALAVATANAARLDLAVELLASDGYEGVAGRLFDLIVANPPYLSLAELAGGPPELAHEPAEALVAGPTGLEALAAVIAGAPGRLRPGGAVLVEIGATQAEAVAELMAAAGLVPLGARTDLAGLPRAVGGRR